MAQAFMVISVKDRAGAFRAIDSLYSKSERTMNGLPCFAHLDRIVWHTCSVHQHI